MFAYCGNNPVNMVDLKGNYPRWANNIGNVVINVVNTVVKTVNKPLNTVQATADGYENRKAGLSNKRPPTGEPGSTYVAPNGDTRTYGPDGKPIHDYDHSDHGNPKNHPHDENGGHHHDWVNGERRGAYVSQTDVLTGLTLVGVGILGMFYVVGNDITGVGAADDFLIEPIGASIWEGLIMIF